MLLNEGNIGLLKRKEKREINHEGRNLNSFILFFTSTFRVTSVKTRILLKVKSIKKQTFIKMTKIFLQYKNFTKYHISFAQSFPCAPQTTKAD